MVVDVRPIRAFTAAEGWRRPITLTRMTAIPHVLR